MMEIYNLKYDSIEIDDIENDKTSEFSEKIKTPKLSEKDKTALLVADLCENKKISLTLFSHLQDLDKNIKKIKKDILSKTKMYWNILYLEMTYSADSTR